MIVFVCHLSKVVWLDSAYSTGLTAQTLFKEILPHYGLPESIVSGDGVMISKF